MVQDMGCTFWVLVLNFTYYTSMYRQRPVAIAELSRLSDNAAPDAAESETVFRSWAVTTTHPVAGEMRTPETKQGTRMSGFPKELQKKTDSARTAQRKEKTPTPRNREEKTRNSRVGPGTVWFP
ncbi:hypothetical protein NDU88_005834 [Pleurodeles waltl]|uniref:Secreted protein n=1 Tax=Pleurodeles waltl TaxID=8319 RepID=A0AAV7WZS8_PLEWA|nr:hypothetical protein NDU88_005834 [Pleurodeles waltl]